ncbi:MAG: hypothetical protein JW944_00760 [Deltaproteobacteria bacterium]|nr:hypothetical protein [Deltaproteobacteria bacterium]
MIKRISFFLAAVLIIASVTLAQSNSLSFTEVADNLNLNKKTSLYVKTYWQGIVGQEVYWIGKVVNVKGGKGKAVVYIADSNRTLYKGYNIVLETYDMESAAMLEVGQSAKFKGLLSDYKGKQGHPIIVYLNQVEFK